MGAYRTDAGQFFVEPLTATSNDTDGDDVYNRPHVVYRRDNAETSFCDVTGQGVKLPFFLRRIARTRALVYAVGVCIANRWTFRAFA